MDVPYSPPRRRRRGVALALVTGMVAVAALSGCSSQGGGSGAPTLTWYINPDSGGQAEIAQRCSAQSGGAYSIKTSLLPRQASSQREQLARRLAAGDTSLDIMSLDPPFVPELAEPGFLAPVPAALAQSSTADAVEGAVKGATWKGKVVAVPFWANTQLLWYKKSVAQQAGLDMSKPVTWDQLMDAARKTHKQLGVQGIRAESMTVWVNALYESQGQSIITNPGAPGDQIQLGLDSPAGQEAARIVGTIGRDGLGGPGIATQNEDVTRQNWQGPDGSFMVNWPFVYTAAQSAVKEGTLDKSVLDDMGWALYPRVSADKETAPPFGGIVLGVGAKSRHVDQAFQAVKCITSTQNQSYYFVSNGNPPASKAAYDDPEVQKAYPMANVIRQSLELAKPRPQTQFYNEVSTGIQQRWTPLDAVTQQTPKETQDFITAVLKGDRLL
ncbi:carbohydrate ABC transporter substrate-binding protein, CUT1 family [Raineyella antarctica]|uniref:Carbohydrate ABC transporter substrate-binding protein, CUT1 family n=1 Tax=Raineyella antarctica TaxID=1577474 RepID=A0A1G6H5J0_9ACTN|nr:carbohydrate ABC transporter substrate-binding protein, CUT1 family [Raineyella antarctica]